MSKEAAVSIFREVMVRSTSGGIGYPFREFPQSPWVHTAVPSRLVGTSGVMSSSRR
jgi:hypothetical protein